MEKKINAKILFLLFFACSLLHSALARPFFPKSELSLKDCIAIGLKHQPDLKAAREKLKAYLAGKGAALSFYFPRFELDSNYFRGNFFAVQGPLSEIFPGIFTVYYTQLSATYVFEDFGKRFARVGKTEAQVEQAAQKYQKERLKVIYSITKAYYHLLKAYAFLKLRKDDLRAAQKNLALAEGLVQTGERSKIVLSEALVSRDTAQYDLIREKHQAADAINHLNQEMGLSNPPLYRIKTESALFPINFSLMKALALAFRLNPDLLAQKAKVKEEQAEVNVITAEKWPVLSGSTSYGWVDEVFPPKFPTWTFGVSLTWPFFNGGLLNEKILEAEAFKKREIAKEKSLILKIQNRVEQNYRAVEDARSDLKAAERELKAAEENYRLTVKRYQFGLSSSVALGLARANLSLARAHQVQALSYLRISEAEVYYSIGMP